MTTVRLGLRIDTALADAVENLDATTHDRLLAARRAADSAEPLAAR